MESTVSVSKGVFLFSNGFNRSKHKTKKAGLTLFEKLFSREAWYTTYKKNWHTIENELKDMHHKTYSMVLIGIVDYIKQSYNNYEALDSVIPSATLLTGISVPDHESQYISLIQMIREDVTPHIALVNSQDGSSIKHLVENTVWQLIHGYDALDTSVQDDTVLNTHKIKKSQCTMKTLKNWYSTKYMSKSPRKKRHSICNRSLVIILPDVESFNSNVLQDYVMIVSSYVPSLPIVLVFGVATSVSALHKSFPYHVSSKLLIKVFHTHSSPVYMNRVLEDIFLSHTSPFHLSGKSFELLTDVFLFYDFSVTGLIQSIKYCMMEHFYGDNLKSLCCERNRLESTIIKLKSEDLENIRKLPSFRPFLEKQNSKSKIKLFEDDNFFREVLCHEMHSLHDYLFSFYMCVRLLCTFVKDMPKNIMGKSVREVYTKCAVETITNTEAFRDCMQLLGFQSQLKLVETIKSAVKIVNSYLQIVTPVKPLRSTPTKNTMSNIQLQDDLGEPFAKAVRVYLQIFLTQIENANTEATILVNNTEHDDDLENTPGSRYRLKQKLLKATRAERVQSEFEMVRCRFISFLEEMFSKGLQAPQTRPFHEILFFSEVSSVRKQIVGSPRGALHTALSNPVHYLQCSCCQVCSESVSATLPDICLAYKLHRECGKHINLYDWLQAFAAVICPDSEDQDGTIQLRFTRAVAELQFLGFIKSSTRKTDHVMRLTW